MRTGLGQRRRAAQADATGCTGDQRPPAVKPEGWHARKIHLLHRLARLRGLAIGHVAAAIAAQPVIGLLGMTNKAFQHA